MVVFMVVYFKTMAMFSF